MQGRGPWLASLGILSILAASVAAAQTEEFTGHGPLPVRNFQPIQLIFLNLPFERARTLPVRGFAIHLESAESNVIATTSSGVHATLKFETNRTVVGGRFGLLPGLEVGLDVPVLSRFGGFLDPFIDGVEHLFGTFNGERDLYPNNTFGAFTVDQGNTVLFHGRAQSLELGDIWASAKYEIWQRPGWPLVALRGAVKAPTGRAGGVFGSGKPDFAVGLALEHRLLDWLFVYSNLAVTYPVGPITAGDLTLNPFVTEGFGGEARIARHWSLVLQQETYTSPFHGTGALLMEGTVVELASGVNFAWEPFLFQLGTINNLSKVAAAADFTLLLRMTYRR